MSKLYDDASLMMIPSSVKDGKLYSIFPQPKPLSGELITNGGFDTDSDWDKFNGATISDGKANIIGDGSAFGYIEQTNTFESGKIYKIELDVVVNSGLGLKVMYGISFSDLIGEMTTSGNYTFYYNSSANDSIIIGRNVGGTAYDSYVDSISVKEVGQNWDLSSSWTISNGTLNGLGGGFSAVLQSLPNISRKIVKLTFEISNYVI